MTLRPTVYVKSVFKMDLLSTGIIIIRALAYTYVNAKPCTIVRTWYES